jgi:hypothetical protein
MFGTFLLFGATLTAVYICGMLTGAKIENDHWQQQAIERGYGGFCERTKAWKWK